MDSFSLNVATFGFSRVVTLSEAVHEAPGTVKPVKSETDELRTSSHRFCMARLYKPLVIFEIHLEICDNDDEEEDNENDNDNSGLLPGYLPRGDRHVVWRVLFPSQQSRYTPALRDILEGLCNFVHTLLT